MAQGGGDQSDDLGHQARDRDGDRHARAEPETQAGGVDGLDDREGDTRTYRRRALRQRGEIQGP